MVVSDTLSYADLYAVLEGATNQRGRTANPILYKPQGLENVLTGVTPSSSESWHNRNYG